jgi:hypothetical protein
MTPLFTCAESPSLVQAQPALDSLTDAATHIQVTSNIPTHVAQCALTMTRP